ncbi:MAG TPA: prolyl oligopeptidase family serine peptidase [Pseudonocardia sp.]
MAASRRSQAGARFACFHYFPDENHWVLTPQHAEIWYGTVLAFLEHHLHGAEFVVPDLLR